MLCQDDPLFTHTKDLSLTFALPHFMAQHNCKDLKLPDTPSTVPTFTNASTDHILNPIYAHNPFQSQDSQDKKFPCPNSGEDLLKESA